MKKHISTAVVIMATQAKRAVLANQQLNRMKNKGVFSGEIFLVAQESRKDFYVDCDSANIVYYKDNNQPALALEICKEKSESDVIIFLSDLVQLADFEKIPALASFLYESGCEAVSPVIWAEGEKIFSGNSFNEMIFYGYSNKTLENELDSCVEKEYSGKLSGSIAFDCFAVRRSVLLQVDGFEEGFGPLTVLELACRLKKAGFETGLAGHININLSSFPRQHAHKYGIDLLRLISIHGALFTRQCSIHTRALLCPSDLSTFIPDDDVVLLVSHELSRSGAPIVLFDMAKELRSLGYCVVIISCFDGPLSEQILKEGFPLLIDHNMRNGRYVIDENINFSPVILLDNIIDAFYITVFNTIVTHNILSRYNGAPHQILWWIHEARHFWSYMKENVPYPLSQNIKVLAGGGFVKQVMEEYGCPYKTEILLYGVQDLSNGCTALKERKLRKITEQEPLRLLFPAAIQMRKGHDVFMKAIQLLPLEYSQKVEVTFIGYPSDPVLAEMVHMFSEVWTGITYLPEVEKDELNKLYLSSDVVVCASRDDPMPVIIPEALSLGCVCVCSTGVGTTYYIEHGKNGFVFENEEAEDLTRCIMNIIDNYEKMEPLLYAGREIFDNVFSIQIFREQLKQYFQRRDSI